MWDAPVPSDLGILGRLRLAYSLRICHLTASRSC